MGGYWLSKDDHVFSPCSFSNNDIFQQNLNEERELRQLLIDTAVVPPQAAAAAPSCGGLEKDEEESEEEYF